MEHFLELPPLRCTWRTQQLGEPNGYGGAGGWGEESGGAT